MESSTKATIHAPTRNVNISGPACPSGLSPQRDVKKQTGQQTHRDLLSTCPKRQGRNSLIQKNYKKKNNPNSIIISIKILVETREQTKEKNRHYSRHGLKETFSLLFFSSLFVSRPKNEKAHLSTRQKSAPPPLYRQRPSCSKEQSLCL